MQTFTFDSFKSPSSFSNSRFLTLVRLFKFELIKIMIFLLLFGASVFIVNGQSEEYYKTQPEHNNEKTPTSNSSSERNGL